RGVRRLVAEHMVRAHREVPPVTWVEECDFSDIDLKRIVPVTLKAVAESLREFPELNARVDGDEIVYLDRYDIGVAVQTEQGLVVPVVRDCATVSVDELASEVERLAEAARAGKLEPGEVRGSLSLPTSRSTTRLSLTRARVGTVVTRNRSASSGCSSTSTCITRRRSRSLRATCAIRLSIRRAGPDCAARKNTRSGRESALSEGAFLGIGEGRWPVFFPAKIGLNAAATLQRDVGGVLDRPLPRGRHRARRNCGGAARAPACAACAGGDPRRGSRCRARVRAARLG